VTEAVPERLSDAVGPHLLELLEATLSAAQVGVALFDHRGRFLWVNETLARMHGVAARLHAGRTPREVIPALADTTEPLLASVLETGQPREKVEILGETPARPGVAQTWEQSWYPVRDRDTVVAVAVLVSEVTAQRTAEAASHERLELALEAGEMGTWSWDLRTDLLEWDERTAGIFGLRPEEFDGTLETFTALLHPDDVDAVRAALEQAITARGALRREYRAVRPDGKVRWLSVRGRVLTDSRGEPETMLGVVQDRTETHSYEERLARTLEHIDEAFYSVDFGWRFTFVNSRAEQLLQRSRDELLGTVIWDLFPGAVGTRIQRQFKHVMATGAPATFEEPYEPLGLWVEARVYPDPGGLSVYFRDITDRKRHDDQQHARAARQQRAHEATVKLLEQAAVFRTDLSPVAAAGKVCAAAVEAFGCTQAAVWQIDGDRATLLAQHAGHDLPAGTDVAVGDLPGLEEALRAQHPRFVLDAQAAGSPEQQTLSLRLGVRSVVQAPVGLGRRAGTLLTLLGWDRPVEPLDRELLDVVQRFAEQVALSVEQARRREAQAQATELNAQLQASLLPATAVRCREMEAAIRDVADRA
jgi:PAS domain S-box-containing protein